MDQIVGVPPHAQKGRAKPAADMHAGRSGWLQRLLRRRALFLALVASLILLSPGVQAEGDVDLRLVLAVDASGSVSPERFDLQRSGYAEAFRHPSVLKAIQSGAKRAIAVTMMQWTGPGQNAQVVPWMRISDQGSMLAVANAIEASPRQLFGGGTSISGAIDQGMMLLATSPFSANRSVIDISGDGGNNRGRLVTEARDEAIAAGAVINGLPILELDKTLDQHYLRNVIGGPNAFMIPAASFAEFADAILKKLIIEIADLPSGGVKYASRARKGCERC
ncbi:MAG: DUF1194 domain-containing protein [Hyphomicrobiaceae bacterium]